MTDILSKDLDPVETKEWLDSLAAVLREEGVDRAHFILQQLSDYAARHAGIKMSQGIVSDYINTLAQDPNYPGNWDLERRIRAIIRWNAAMMVQKANKKELALGGHISSFAGAATIYDVGFNHFFRGPEAPNGADLLFIQGHSSPGIYARAFAEGRISKEQLDNFRQETTNNGLSSYPHPHLMPDFWEFPTVSMGLGPIAAIYQARFMKYLTNRGLKDCSDRKVYAFLGDGEMDEPESKGAIAIATREDLDNLIFVVSCNLQRLDGPVVGNGKVIQELEGQFKGAGWDVFKVIWGRKWDELLKKDTSGKLIQLMNETVDGDYQNLKSKDGTYLREHFFNRYPETAALVKDMSDDEIFSLNRGGHDPLKLFNAFSQAQEQNGRPKIILAKTIKGYGLGRGNESQNTAHNVKKMNTDTMRHLRDKLNIPISNEQLEHPTYIEIKEGSEEYNYLQERRKKLGGYLPARRQQSSVQLQIPELAEFSSLLEEQKRDISTTMAVVRALNVILKSPSIGKRIVPILSDEARTFGMEGLFRQIGIYNPKGQLYTPTDRDQMAYYKEDVKGQVLQDGLTEMGAVSSWVAAATAYSVHDCPMIPFFVYYSMFGFQRIGDMLWAAGDMQAKGFMIGGTSGRTTLNGEGLQHQDGHSHILASTIPNCIAYDATYAYEVAVILQDGLRRMYGDTPENVFYYLTTLNENYHQPAMPEGVEDGICKGIYKLETIGETPSVQLLGSGAILPSVREAARILQADYAIGSDLFAVTSFNELARNGQDVERHNRLHPGAAAHTPYISTVLGDAPTIASTDYMRSYAEQVRAFIPSAVYTVLGTDGFGRSDSRENLRRHFEVDAAHVVVATLSTLAELGQVEKKIVSEAIARFGIDADKVTPRNA